MLHKKGFLVVISWPDTYCKNANAWYDPIIQFVGIGTDGYYKVGHAAMVLIDEKGQCSYFDFGRYNTPKENGRVRSAQSDDELTINTIVGFSLNGEPLLNDLLSELKGNGACKGTGRIRAGYVEVNLDATFQYVLDAQRLGNIPYGPFTIKGTNCSRFVRNAIIRGIDNKVQQLKLRAPWMITPSPLWLVKRVGEYKGPIIYSQRISSDTYKVA